MREGREVVILRSILEWMNPRFPALLPSLDNPSHRDRRPHHIDHPCRWKKGQNSRPYRRESHSYLRPNRQQEAHQEWSPLSSPPNRVPLRHPYHLSTPLHP